MKFKSSILRIRKRGDLRFSSFFLGNNRWFLPINSEITGRLMCPFIMNIFLDIFILKYNKTTQIIRATLKYRVKFKFKKIPSNRDISFKKKKKLAYSRAPFSFVISGFLQLVSFYKNKRTNEKKKNFCGGLILFCRRHLHNF